MSAGLPELVGVGVVIDDGSGPRLCLGLVHDLLAPQSDGPPVAGWDWDAVTYDEAAGTRWGDYAVTGTWDGETFSVTREPVPASLHDAAPLPAPDDGAAAGCWESELLQVQAELAERREELGVESSYVDAHRLLVTVFHDDGTIQAMLDEEYGAGVVRVVSALQPVGA